MSAFDSFPLGKPAFVGNILDRAAYLRTNEQKLFALESDPAARAYVISRDSLVVKREGEASRALLTIDEALKFGANPGTVFLGMRDGAAVFGMGISPAAVEKLTGRDDVAVTELRGMAKLRPDFEAMLHGGAIPAPYAQARDLVRGQLRGIAWRDPPVVVLMPVPTLWSRDVLGKGQHAWALYVLQPLVDEGRVRVLDATDLFSGDAGECGDFFDFYHQNANGRQRLDTWLKPRLEPQLDAAAQQARPAAAH